ncbi:nucleoprotein TPR-like isoform X2 [Linepithema humile]|uniref:nucleoprotein TPR-like isoform X2 n=1 Tax=Linepithema humile TaxID=83485 RepID=UPI00351E2BF7
MADDPNRDIVPVKEGSCADTINSAIDPRERHLVCKLDRYQLEDKYLRLFEEANNLKKLSNCQEDKIKRLGTKLIRLAGTPRPCGLVLDIADDKNRTAALELENTKLKEKITVMRNQLLSHTINGRSSSRSRNIARPTSSGFMTCRSENNRARIPSCQCVVATADDDNDVQNYLVKIEKLEAQKKDMACHIAEMEKELALSTCNQKEKVAENVEYIRVWRQMKQLNDKLITAQEKNTVLTTEINELKITLEQTTRNNQEITAVLTSERTRIAEIDDQMLKAKNSQLTLREKDEQIKDLMNEIKILQQHNNELIALTSKYGQVELENIELRRKLSEHAQEQQILKTAFNNEQANIIALKSTNEQLLAKLQDLQANIDTLTVQLATFHKQNEKHGVTIRTPSDVSTNMQSISLPEQCKKCCEMYDKITRGKALGSTRENDQLVDKSIQTITVITNVRTQSTMTISEEKEEKTSPLKEWKTNEETNGANVLSREKILKLLDQAQINMPLDASRVASKEEYTGILDMAQRHSDGEISSRTFRDESKSVQKSLRKKLAVLENPNITLGQIFLILIDVWQEYISFNNINERTSPNQVFTIENPPIDMNNNNLTTMTTHDVKQIDPSADTNSDKNCETDEYFHKGTKTSDCTCKNSNNCCTTLESDYCYCTSCTSRSTAVYTDDSTNVAYEGKSATISTRDIGSSTKDTIDATFLSTIYEKCKKSFAYRDNSNNFCAEKAARMLKRPKSPRSPRCNLTCHLRRAKNSQEKQKLPCRQECLNDSMPVYPMESFPLLITDRQGLIEIHISRLQLFTSIAKIPEEEDICNLHIYISWDIWDEKTAYTPRMKCPNLVFNSSSVYRIANLFSFFKNVLSEYLVFRVNIVRPNDTTCTLARAKVSIKDILDYPQNKLHYIVPVNSVISCFFGVNFGQLSLWVRLSCNVDMVKAFKKQCGIASRQNSLVPSVEKDVTAPRVLDEKETPVPEDSNDQHVQSTLDSNFENKIENSEDENFYNSDEGFFSPVNDTTKASEDENGIVSIKRLGFEADDSITETENDTARDSSSVKEFRSLLANDQAARFATLARFSRRKIGSGTSREV